MADLLDPPPSAARTYGPPAAASVVPPPSGAARPESRAPAPSYRPAWWVPGAHVQTIYGKLVRRPPHAPVRTERWDTPDGDFLDVALFIGRVAAEHPAAPLALCGVSLGGNQLVKYLGERGLGERDAPDGLAPVPPNVRGATAVSVPYDLARGSRHIGRGFSRVYERHFLRSLVRKAELKMLAYPDLVDRRRLAELRTLWDFDDVLTGPLHGFRDAADYYGRSSAIHYLAGVRVPTLLLSAADDPFLPAAVLDDVRHAAAGNPCLTVEFHPHGGHVGFVGGRDPRRPDYYAERRTMEWAAAHVGPPAP
jgi:hypothetical protein